MSKLLINALRLHFSPGPAGALPEKLLVARWGNNPSVKGDFIINETTVRELPGNQAKVNFDTVDLDFEHNTVPGSPAFKASSEPRKRAARGTLEVVEGEGVYLHTAADRWTPEGEEAVQGKHYSDLSPTILTNEAGEVVFIHSVALARQGAAEGLELQLNSADPLAALTPDSPKSESTQTHSMDFKLILTALLGLSADATDAQIHTAAGDFYQKLNAAQAAPQLPEDVSNQLKTMSTSIEDLQKKLDGQERQSLIAAAIRDGKLVPNSVQDLDLAKLKSVLEELPSDQVPVGRRTPEGLKLHSSSISSGSGEDAAAEAAVKKGLGISDEAWTAHNK